MDLGEERREDAEQEILLQLAHVGVEPPVGVAVTLDVEEEHPAPAGLGFLRLTNEPEERACRVLEPLVGEHDMVDGHAPVVGRRPTLRLSVVRTPRCLHV